jgi:hypothetical protein
VQQKRGTEKLAVAFTDLLAVVLKIAIAKTNNTTMEMFLETEHDLIRGRGNKSEIQNGIE